ncbi:hypothetical protein CPB83DRAFT_398313 [Crepidotus variabilis]|uniref:Uncharacterized protein n=1 Tax=Crepidotus variabilis TaxID=179855 RepID=A0A9P6EEH0_9AGAR|nr:hypothetical protein CPB83DRAFT_398313 [Crepidotus variabilis]
MPSHSPTLATISRLCLLIFLELCLIHAAVGQLAKDEATPRYRNTRADSDVPPTNHETSNDLLCTPFGGCEPCPPDAINLPFCRPFGNRRLMHCVNVTDSASQSPSDPKSDPHDSHKPPHSPSHDSTNHPAGEVLAWESCGRIVEKESADFYEFIAVNVVFAIIALGVLFFRSRRMELMQARQLAARIGLLRDDGIRREPRL